MSLPLPPSSRRRRTRRGLAAVAAGAGIALAGSLGLHSADATPSARQAVQEDTLRQAATTPGALRVFGLTPNGRLLRFEVGTPRQLTNYGIISGLEGDTRLVGIDFRVQDDGLYGVGNQGGVYKIARFTAVATKVSQLEVPLNGTHFGVDFNPAADRLRIVSDTGQNLRHDVNNVAVPVTTVDGPLTYPPLPEVATGITAAAYTNNDLDADTSTTLFDVDTNLHQVAIQSPANSGQLAATGKTGVELRQAVGFDIYSFLDDTGATQRVSALATAKVMTGGRNLYRVNLVTGEFTSLGVFPTRTRVVDIALPLDQR
ncbi:MAG: DUF4394 domain-containing protein [Actinomycetota bacterium]|nr:DUF4394 domain-containing protein [Actinomycetota bacterium]